VLSLGGTGPTWECRPALGAERDRDRLSVPKPVEPVRGRARHERHDFFPGRRVWHDAGVDDRCADRAAWAGDGYDREAVVPGG
jgi:hypothetical protein